MSVQCNQEVKFGHAFLSFTLKLTAALIEAQLNITILHDKSNLLIREPSNANRVNLKLNTTGRM